jgi:REP element-mobilizing transposase RayT
MKEEYSYYRNLPHWRDEVAVYFVTWRLHQDQAPLVPVERRVVGDALMHFDGRRYLLFGWVVMHDHVHVIVQPESQPLADILHTWKSYTAWKLQREGLRQGRVWQDESWDRLVRDERELAQKMTYVWNNPICRWPELQGDYEWRWVSPEL